MMGNNRRNARHLLRFGRALLRTWPLRAIRRNHALEHATAHILQQQYRNLRLSGYSVHHGFALLGDIPAGAAETAAREALKRLREGQSELAIHPHCGTNLAIQALLCALIGFFGFAGRSRRQAFARLNPVASLILLATLASPPIGMAAQAHITTESQIGALELVSVTRHQFTLPLLGKITAHQFRTRHS